MISSQQQRGSIGGNGRAAIGTGVALLTLLTGTAYAQMQPLDVPAWTNQGVNSGIDQYVNGFDDQYTSTTTDTTYVLPGHNRSKQVYVPGWWFGLIVSHDNAGAFNAAPFDTVTFYLNSGPVAQQMPGAMIVCDEPTPNTNLPQIPLTNYLYDVNGNAVTGLTQLPANTWYQARIPLAALGLNSGNNHRVKSINLATPNATAMTFYVDEVHFNGPSPSSVANIAINVGNVIGTASERVRGVNTTFWGVWAGDNGNLNSFANLLNPAGLRALRYGSGSGSNGFDWSAYESDYYAFLPNPRDFTNLLTQLSNPQAYIITNYGEGSPEMAAAWVAYYNMPDDPLLPNYNTPIGSGRGIVRDANGQPMYDASHVATWGNVDWKTYGFWAHLRASAPNAGYNAALNLWGSDGYDNLRINHPQPFGIKYWEIGNENYGSWEPDFRPAGQQWDSVQYANFFKSSKQKMLVADPTIKVGAQVNLRDNGASSTSHTVTNPVTGAQESSWDANLLYLLAGRDGSAKVLPDFVIDHYYQGSDGNQSDFFNLHIPYDAHNWTDRYNAYRTELNQYLSADAPNVEINCTETNTANNRLDKTSANLINGLFLADSVGQMLNAGYKSMFWWESREGNGNFVNQSDLFLYGWRMQGEYGILSGGGATDSNPAAFRDAKLPTYFALKLLSQFVSEGDSILSVTQDPNNQFLTVYAIKHGTGVNLLALNKAQADGNSASTVNQITGNFALSGFTPASLATTYRFGVDEDNAAKSDNSSTGTRTDLTASSVAIAGANFSVPFPAYSMTVVKLTPTVPTAPTPTFNPAGGTYSSAQSVTLSDTLSGATIYYTTDGTTPTVSSTRYTAPIAVSTTKTIKAIAVASGYNNSAVASATYTINTGTAVKVNLSAAFNLIGFYNDGVTFSSSGGIDRTGNAYSGTLLGTSVAWGTASFNLGASGSSNVVAGTGQTITFAASEQKKYSSLKMLGTGVMGNQPAQTFKVTYTDNTTATFTQGMSDWFAPQSYSGETIVKTMAYRNSYTGTKDNRTFVLYGYSFPLNAAKTLKSVTLPNNGYVCVLGITLIP